LRVVTLAAAVVGLYFAGRGVSLDRVAAVLRTTRVVPFVASALVIQAFGFVIRAARFRAVIGETPLSFAKTVATMLLSQAGNNILPLRAGELVKTHDFVAAGHPAARVLATQGAEKLVEASMLVTICAPAFAIRLGGRARLFLLAGVVTLVFLPLLVWVARRLRMRPVQIAKAFAWSLAADVFEVALVSVTLRNVGLSGGLVDSLAVLGAVNLAIALPSVPGHVGAFEAGAALGVLMLGASHDTALAFALLYRAVQWVPVTIGGGIVWGWRAARGRAERRDGSPTGAPASTSIPLRPSR
jgi:uncharacterized membrane protein YbhN (UPF0104 family)